MTSYTYTFTVSEWLSLHTSDVSPSHLVGALQHSRVETGNEDIAGNSQQQSRGILWKKVNIAHLALFMQA